MKRVFGFAAAICFCATLMVGCAEKATTTKETTVSTPEGETNVKVTEEVTQSGENPPPAQQ